MQLHPRCGRQLGLGGGQVIGRAATCDVRLEDPLVSRRHARVWDCEGAAAIEDLGSANGLYLNGRRCRGLQRVRPGDVIQLGGTLWKVLSADPSGVAGWIR